MEVWEGTREALTSLAVDTALSSSLERRVTALEGVRASDQDICQVWEFEHVGVPAGTEPGRVRT